jgi:hypothetical protein
MDLIGRVKDILLRPKDTWPAIRDEAGTVKDLTKSYAAILALVPALAEVIGAVFIGHTFMGVSYRTTLGNGLARGLVSYAASLACMFVIASILNALAPRFESRKNFLQAFKLVVYSWTASWVAGILLLLPSFSWLATLGSFYSLYLFYVGLPLLMETTRERLVVYFLVVIALSIVVTAFVGATVALIFLQGSLP